MPKKSENKEDEKMDLVLPEEEDSMFFSTRKISRVADLANVLSWVALVGFIADAVVKTFFLRSQIVQSTATLSDFLKDLSFHSYLFSNVIEPMLYGLIFFAVLQGVSVGLDALLELLFKDQESK